MELAPIQVAFSAHAEHGLAEAAEELACVGGRTDLESLLAALRTASRT